MAAMNMIGEARVAGMNGGTLAVNGGLAAVNNVMDSAALRDEWSTVDSDDGYGDTKSRVYSNHQQSATFTVYIKDNAGTPTQAGARVFIDGTTLAKSMPLAGSIVTIASTGTILDGTWNYNGGGSIDGGAGFWRMVLPCVRFGSLNVLPVALAVVG